MTVAVRSSLGQPHKTIRSTPVTSTLIFRSLDIQVHTFLAQQLGLFLVFALGLAQLSGY